MTDKPLMPLATAVWLIDNTSITFDQVADFCALHPLQVKGIADGDVATGVRGINPITNNQLTREEIEKGEADEKYRMKLSRPKIPTAEKQRKGPRYTPVSKRQNRPDAIAWLVRNHPEISDAQIGKLLGTTKTTIQAVRDRTHWNSPNITPQDPVGLGLCSQIELDAIVRKAAARKPKLAADADVSARLIPAEDALHEGPTASADEDAPSDSPPDASVFNIPDNPAANAQEEEDEDEKNFDADEVFANLGGGDVQPAAEDDE